MGQYYIIDDSRFASFYLGRCGAFADSPWTLAPRYCWLLLLLLAVLCVVLVCVCMLFVRWGGERIGEKRR